MNTNPTAKTILCYGDSNTWGQMPDGTRNRYAPDVRWTGVLQKSLGNNYAVIEEGLSSRTTDLDYPKKTGRNGRTYLELCLDSHAPIDVVILMLGTNDLKIEFNRSASQIAQALQGLVEIIQHKMARYTDVPGKIMLVSPILVDSTSPKLKEWYSAYYDETSAQKSQQLAGQLAEVAQATNCLFLDAAQVAKAGQDGIHFDRASHLALGGLLAKELRLYRL